MITRWQTRKIFRLCSKWNTRLARGLNLLSPFHTGPNHVIWKKNRQFGTLNNRSFYQYFEQSEKG